MRGTPEVSRSDLDVLEWSKSSFSNNSCVETAPYGDGRVAVRDSKNPSQGFLLYDAGEWRAFLAGVRNGEFDYLVPE
jgi:hypothetical protein